MKNAARTAGLILLLILCANVPVIGQSVYVNMDEIEGLGPMGMIQSGSSITVPVRFANAGEPRTAISNGFRFKGNGVSCGAVEGNWNPDYPWNYELAYYLGCLPPSCYPFFDRSTYISHFVNGIGFTGVSGISGTGLPVDFDGIAYYITVNNIVGNGPFVMDSSWWTPANFWLWSGVVENVDWGGPYEFWVCCPPPCEEGPHTTCWPQPLSSPKTLENDGMLNISIHCEENDQVILESVRVQGKLPAFTEVRLEGDSIVTDCFLPRFLGVSGFRPIPPEGIFSTYTVQYDRLDGSHVVLTGEFVMAVFTGDVDLDGLVDIDDIIYMTDYAFNGGPGCAFSDEPLDELMDIDRNGRFDLLDIRELIQITGN